MHFFAPENFLFLWLAPAVLLVFWLSSKFWKKRMHSLIHEETLREKLVAGYRSSEWFFRSALLALAVIFAVLALARPQWGDEKKQVQRKGVDLVFLVDTSLSMLAEDIKPNRLEKVKFEIDAFLKELRGDRVGMVTFAGSGFLQTPLTLDHSAFMLFLDAVQVGFIPDPGTSLGQAIRLAIRAFPQKELKYKALIIFSDGEDHGGGLDAALEEAREAHIRIYTIGLGTPEGEPIPLRSAKGERSGFKKDRSGQMVITKLNAPLLQKIARETDGLYLPATPSEKEVSIIVKHLKSWGEQKFSEKMVVEKEDQYQPFLFLALLCLVAEMLIRRKDRKIASALGCALIFFLFSGFLGSSGELIDKGNEEFEEKRYQSALENYRKVQIRKPDDPEVLYNLGTALYKTDEFKEAAKDLEEAAKSVKDPELKTKALYNFGNAQYRLGNFEGAIDAYKKTLELDPDDKDAKYNLEFLQRQKNEFDKKNQDRQNEKQKDPQQQQQKQNQQDEGGGKDQEQEQEQQKNQQDQQDQQQGQQDQQDQEKQEQQDQKSEGQQQQQQDQQDQEQQEQPQDGQDQKDQQPDQKDGEKEQPQEPQNEGQDQGQDEQQQGQQKQPLQGQMSMQNALTILDALKDSEKDLQDLRRPKVNRNPPPVDKDW